MHEVGHAFDHLIGQGSQATSTDFNTYLTRAERNSICRITADKLKERCFALSSSTRICRKTWLRGYKFEGSVDAFYSCVDVYRFNC